MKCGKEGQPGKEGEFLLREEVGGLHFGCRQGCSKKGGEITPLELTFFM